MTGTTWAACVLELLGVFHLIFVGDNNLFVLKLTQFSIRLIKKISPRFFFIYFITNSKVKICVRVAFSERPRKKEELKKITIHS